MNKEMSYLGQDFCWNSVSKEVKCTFSMRALPLKPWECCWLEATCRPCCSCLAFYFFPPVHSRRHFALNQLSISSDFMYFHSHVKAGKTHNKGTRFLEPKSWLHNRNLHQINFPQAAVSGLSMLRAHVRILEACTFLSRQLRIDSLHLRKWKDKNIGCCQRKFLDQVVVRKSCRVLYYFLLWKSPEVNDRLESVVEGNPG